MLRILTATVEDCAEAAADRLSGPSRGGHREHTSLVHVREEGGTRAETGSDALEFDRSQVERIRRVRCSRHLPNESDTAPVIDIPLDYIFLECSQCRQLESVPKSQNEYADGFQ